MKKQKFFDKRLSSIFIFSLFSLGIFPALATASEDLKVNSENILTPSDNLLISEPRENPVEIKVSDIASDSVDKFSILEENNVISEQTENALDIRVSDITSLSPENQTNTETTETPLNQNISTPETLNRPTFSENTNFNFEPISLAEALKYSSDETMAQVNNVNQLRDVSPTDWAYQALRNLVENYDCLEGYPDRTFRGDRAMTRYEFAAGLNACLDKIGPTQDLVSTQDLDTVRRLVAQFQEELNALGTRVDGLEERVAVLEDNQFSTTTKLFGQVIFGLQGRGENEYTFGAARIQDTDTNINTITNTQLSLFTQFGPRSILLTGLSAGSGSTGITGLKDFVRLGYEGDSNNDIGLSDLSYRHLITDNFSAVVGTAGVNAVNVFRGPNRVESAGFGPLSRFAQRNPIINVGAGGAGAGFDWQIWDRLSMQGVYSTNLANNSTFGGLFGGNSGTTTLGMQLIATPVDNVDVAFQYLNAYSPFGDLGTAVGDSTVSAAAPINTDAFGGSVDWRIAPAVTVGGWAGYTTSTLETLGGDVDTFNWMSYVTFPDLFAEGNLGAIFVGQPPKITDSNLPVGFNIPDVINNGNLASQPGGQPSTATHIEAFYRFKVNENISITPGVIVVLNPGHNSANDTITIGAIRTTLTF